MVIVDQIKVRREFFSGTTKALIASGDIGEKEAITSLLHSHKGIIAVDGGLVHCHVLGVTPELIIGDLDSIPQELLKVYSHVPMLSFPVDKDETDLELALKLVFQEDIQRAYVYGALGGRLDHLLGNIVLLTRYPGRVFLETEGELAFVINETVEVGCYIGQKVSLIPFNGEVKGISTVGLKWELNKSSLSKNFLGISNQCISEKFSVTVEQGDLLCCLNKKVITEKSYLSSSFL